MKKLISKYKVILLMLLIVAAAFFVSRFAFQLSVIHGASMEPTYGSFGFAIVNRLDRSPGHGDVVAVNKNGVGSIIKRVYAVPGDSVEFIGDALLINGEVMLTLPQGTPQGDTVGDGLILGDGEYFVLGDNLAESRDSRFSEIGTVKADEIVGTVIPSKPRKSE